MERLFSPEGYGEPGAGPFYLQLQRRIGDEDLAARLADHGERLFASDDVEFRTSFPRAWPPAALPLALRRAYPDASVEASYWFTRETFEHARSGFAFDDEVEARVEPDRPLAGRHLERKPAEVVVELPQAAGQRKDRPTALGAEQQAIPRPHSGPDGLQQQAEDRRAKAPDTQRQRGTERQRGPEQRASADEAELKHMVATAVAIDDRPSALR